MLNGGISFYKQGIVDNIRAMRMQTALMSIANDNITGFDKVGYQRKIPVVSSFAEYIGEAALSTTLDSTVGRLAVSENPLDIALAEKGYFQILTSEGVRLTRDGRFKLNKDGELLSLEDGRVLDNAGNPIVLPFIPENLQDISVGLDGVIKVLDSKTRKMVPVATLSVVTQEGTAVLAPNVRQGYNEYSNVSMQTEFLQAMQYPKTFEANRQLYRMQNSNLQRVISSLGGN